MVNVIWTGDTLAIVWFWQVSNLIYMPYCVSSMPERKLITFDTLYVLCCSVELLLFAWFTLISLSTIKQQLNKQEGVFSEGLYAGSVERCQMTAPDFDESHVLMNVWFSLCSNTLQLLPFHFRCCCSLHCPAADMAAELRGGSNIVQ